MISSKIPVRLSKLRKSTNQGFIPCFYLNSLDCTMWFLGKYNKKTHYYSCFCIYSNGNFDERLYCNIPADCIVYVDEE